jgi:Mg2+ and Co2+ transporter CorA
LDLIKKFYEWQKTTLRSFDLVLNPATYTGSMRHEERDKLFEMEYEVVLGQDARLDKDIRDITKLLELCSWMVEQIRERTEIMKDDQGQVLLIFTTVTVVFLPLSFVASYVSMSGGTTGLDWGGLQGLFWKVAGPLTACVIIFCLVVAQRRRLSWALPSQWMGMLLEWKYSASAIASRSWSRLATKMRGRNKEEEENSELLD